MKKAEKLILAMMAGLIVLLMTLLTSCGTRITYPNLVYNNSKWAADVKDRTILLREGYVLNDGNPYDIIETEEGYDLLLHFAKQEAYDQEED